MIINKVVVCPICGKKTFLRIQDGGYLSEYPIRINCLNCRTLIKGIYIMAPESPFRGLHLLNADIEECSLDNQHNIINADYVAEVSGELPCKKTRKYDGGIPLSPFMNAVDKTESMLDRIDRLSYFSKNMEDWKRTKSTAFQLLEEGSIEYIATALKNKMGNYTYECDNYLKALHCLQEVVIDETKYLFLSPDQDSYISSVIRAIASLDAKQIHELAQSMGGIHALILAYRKIMGVFSNFMDIYANILPAETYIRFKKHDDNEGIATCSFGDLKTFYQDSYEALLSLLYIPVCLDNIQLRGDFQKFSCQYDDVRCDKNKEKDFQWYCSLDNGTRINKLCENEHYQGLIALTANRFLRNGIGHNNIKYDPIEQTIVAFDLKRPNRIRYQGNLMDMAVDCLSLAKTAVIYSEIILFMLRKEFYTENIRTIIHPRFYKGVQVNDMCPCGSEIKYKKCCRNDVEKLTFGTTKN